jgi:excisionase family DNA binding protein
MNDSSTRQRELLDVWQVATYLNTTERWVRRAVAERRFPIVKLGAMVRVDRADLDSYIIANKAVSK